MINVMGIVQAIWDFLVRFETLFSIITMFVVVATFFKVYKQNKIAKELSKQAPKIENFKEQVTMFEGKTSSNPVALAMSLVETTISIKGDVESFLKYKKIDMEIEELNMRGINSSNDLEDFINQLRQKRELFCSKRITEIHLFIQGPVMAGVLVGAMFDNWIPVKLYHKTKLPLPNIYQYWMPLLK